MFLQEFLHVFLGMLQIIVLGAAGFFLAKRTVIDAAGIHTLSKLVVELTLPLLIFSQLVKEFSFSLYPRWWLFPLLSLGMSVLGLVCGMVSLWTVKGREARLQFLSLNIFQNSGYLPLALIIAIVPAQCIAPMQVYLFLFLVGFNLLIWSVGAYMLTSTTTKRFAMGSLFSPPVIATLVSLLLVTLRVNTFVPDVAIKPLKLLGECTVPIAMLVVGANLAQLRLGKRDWKPIAALIFVRMLLLPGLGLLLLLKFGIGGMLGLFILMQLAVPPATSLSVIMSHAKKDDILISEGIFYGHLAALVTLPLFLGFYFALNVVK